MADRKNPDTGAPVALSSAQTRLREGDLQDGLDQLSTLVMEALPLKELLTEVARAASEAVPGADGVGVTLLRSDRPDDQVQSLGLSHPFVEEIDLVQYELLDEGPCITAARDRLPVISAAVGKDDRWPRFGPRVARLGVRGVLSLPMLLKDGAVVGAINCYSYTENAFDDDAIRIGSLFANPAAVAVHNSQVLAQAQSRALQLQTALISRTTIDQAVGILRSRTGASPDEAFDRLREISQHDNIKLSVVAGNIVEEAVRRARARHSRDDPAGT